MKYNKRRLKKGNKNLGELVTQTFVTPNNNQPNENVDGETVIVSHVSADEEKELDKKHKAKVKKNKK